MLTTLRITSLTPTRFFDFWKHLLFLTNNFDTYKDTGIEDVYTCTVYNARSQRRMFFGNVILTFDTEANAKVRASNIICF